MGRNFDIFILFVLAAILGFPIYLRADAPNLVGGVSCSGQVYRSKKDGIPVYSEPTTTGEVVGHLVLGEKVCYLGEQGGFATVSWKTVSWKTAAWKDEQSEAKSANSTEVGHGGGAKPAKFGYIRVVDLWEAPRNRSRAPRGLIQRLIDYFHFVRNGGVPDTGVYPTIPGDPAVSP